MSAPATHGSPDVESVLTEQHEQLKTLMEQVVASPAPDRQALFDQVRRLLAAHEAAEAEVVHPIARKDLGSADAVVAERLAEEDDAGEAVARLEQLDVGSEEFAAGFAALQKSVIAHAEAEEHQELPAVAGDLTAEQQQDMVAALTQVPALARSHAEQLDSFAAMLHTARDHFHAAPRT